MSSITNAINERYKGRSASTVVRDTLLIVAACKLVSNLATKVYNKGLKATLQGYALSVISKVDFTGTVEGKLRSDVIKSLVPEEVIQSETNYELPEDGVAQDVILDQLRKWSHNEHAVWGTGKASGAVYHGDPAFLETLTQAYSLFALANPLHPELFPWVRKMEAEVVRMTASLFHGDDQVCGSMTSGGTESILMAMKAYRDRGLVERGIRQPEIIACATAHAAFDKAANYFGIKLISVPADPVTQRVPVDVVAGLVNANTVALVASAPGFPHGVVDDVPALGALAREHGLGLHVDCCLGSFLIPFAKELGADIPDFDFAVAGVTSLSADTHKYGFAPKGSSVVLFRDAKLRHFMYYVSTTWTGGVYASPTITGSRSGALIASTWAALMCMGRSGYKTHMRAILDAANRIRGAIGKGEVPGVKVVGDSALSVVAFDCDDICVYAVSCALSKRGWHLNALQRPKCVHLCVTYANQGRAEEFIADLAECVKEVRENPSKYKGGAVQIYGLSDAVGDSMDESGNATGLVAEMAKVYIDTLTYLPAQQKPEKN
jgi:sphinganine-1-phosphate aldolase